MDTRKNNQSLLIGVTGLVVQVGGIFTAPLFSELFSMPTDAAALAGFGVAMVGTAILIWGMCLYAQAKEQSGWWGLMGLLGIIGLIVLSTLPDRHEQRSRAQRINADITQPPDNYSVAFTCFGCGYTLNGVTTGGCPECGRPFDPANLATVMVNDRAMDNKPPWTSRWSLICGILGFATFCIGMIIPGLGVLFGHMALHTIKYRPKKTDRGVAIAGLVCSYLTLLAGIGIFVSIILSAAGVI